MKDFFIKEYFIFNIWIYCVEVFDYVYLRVLEGVKNEEYIKKIKDIY